MLMHLLSRDVHGSQVMDEGSWQGPELQIW